MKFVAICFICVTAAICLAADTVIYKDGIYTGSGKGKKGPIPVTVEIKGGKIYKITPGKNKEFSKRFLKVLKSYIPAIIKKQSTDVDMVTGATLSCKGTLVAVKQALGKASEK